MLWDLVYVSLAARAIFADKGLDLGQVSPYFALFTYPK